MFKGKATLENGLLFYLSVILPFSYLWILVDPTNTFRLLTLNIVLGIVWVGFIFQKEQSRSLLRTLSQYRIGLGLYTAYIVWSLIAGINSYSLSSFSFEFAKIFSCLIFFVTVLHFLRTSETFKNKLFKSVGVFILISCTIGLTQYIYNTNVKEIISVFCNKNLFASILFLGFPFVYANYQSTNDWINKAFSIITLALLVGFVVILETRAVWVGFLVGIIVTVVIGLLYTINFRNKIRYYKSIIAGAFAIFLGIIVVGFVAQDTLITNYNGLLQLKKELNETLPLNSETTSKSIDPIKKAKTVAVVGSIETRYLLLLSTVKMVKEYPIFGVGLGNWRIVFPKYGLVNYARPAQQGKVNYQRAHNDWIQIAAESGVVGLLLYVLFFTIAFYKALYLIFKTENENKVLITVYLATLIGYAFIMAFDFPKERVEHNLLMLVIIALIFSEHKTRVLFENNNSSKIVLIIVVFMIAESGYISYKMVNGEKLSRKIEKFHSLSKWNDMKLTADKLAAQHYEINPYSIPTKWYSGVASFSAGNMQEALNDFLLAEKINPYNINVLNNIASTYYQLGDAANAEIYYKKVLLISPYYDEALINLSVIYYNSKQYELALKIISTCNNGSPHPNYKRVLIAVLKQYLSEFSKNHPGYETRIEIIKSNDKKLKNIYDDAVKNGMDFPTYFNSKYQEWFDPKTK